MKQQIIWTGDTYEAVTPDNSELPQWPVQDAGAHWHYEQFAGQKVHYNRAQVWFGQMCESVVYSDGINQDGLIVLDDGTVWREIS